MKHKNPPLVFTGLAVGLLLCAIGCKKQLPQDPAQYSKALIVLPGASEVKYNKADGTEQVVYKFVEPYPAAQMLKQISSQLEASGWTPLKEDALNPCIQSSYGKGWTISRDVVAKRQQPEVRQWITDWENNRGDNLRYALDYSYPQNSPSSASLSTVRVIEIFTPAEVFKSALSKREKGCQDSTPETRLREYKITPH